MAEEQAVPGRSTTPGVAGDGGRPAKTGYVPVGLERELIGRVENRINFQTRESARWAMERAMFEQICFAVGVQWIEYTESTRRFAKWNAPSWFPTPVQNEIGPRLSSMVARLLRSKPQARVRPDTNSPADHEGAKVAEKLIGHFDDVTDEDNLRQDAALIAAYTGTVIAYDGWNPTKGPVLRIPRMQVGLVPAMEPAATCPGCGLQAPFPQVGQLCPQCSQQLQQGTKPKLLSNGQPARVLQQTPVLDPITQQPIVDEVRQGEIESRVRMLFNFYWDPKCARLREARWCGEAHYADLDWIDQNYPQQGPYVAEESGIDAANFYESSLLALVGPSIQGSAHYGGSGFLRGGAVVRVYQEKPSQRFPKGLHLVVANGVLLYPRPGPDGQFKPGDLSLLIRDRNQVPTGDFNYSEFRYDLVPGRFPGRTPCEDMVPLQRQVNGITAQRILNRKTLLNPSILAPKGCGLVDGQVAMKPAAVTTYNPVLGMKPEVIKGVGFPQDISQEKNEAIQAIDRLSQDQRIGQGEVPHGVKSGIALNFLKEAGEEASVPRLQRWGQWIAERNRKRLLIAAEKYREDRAVKVVGPGSEWQVRHWSGADLANQTDVSVDAGTLMPRSQAAKTQLMLDAIEQGIIDLQDPIQRQRVIEELGLTEFETQIGPDKRRAEKENAQMEEGIPAQLLPTDDHNTHLTEHLAVVKGPEFDSKPPQVKQLLMTHIQAHQQMQAQQQMMQQVQQAAAAAQGGQQQPQQGQQGQQAA